MGNFQSTADLIAERDALKSERDEWHGIACGQLKTIEELRAENERLKAERDLLDARASACQQFHTNITQLMADNKELAAEVERLKALWQDDEAKGVAREAALETQLRELREAHDLLHKRIEAYDETHAYLKELREASEGLGRAARQTILTDLTSYTERELETAIARVEALLGLKFVSMHEPSQINHAPNCPAHDGELCDCWKGGA